SSACWGRQRSRRRRWETSPSSSSSGIRCRSRSPSAASPSTDACNAVPRETRLQVNVEHGSRSTAKHAKHAKFLGVGGGPSRRDLQGARGGPGPNNEK